MSCIRNGAYFGVILEFLRSGEINIPKDIIQHTKCIFTDFKFFDLVIQLSRKSVLIEARFFLIEGLVELLEQEESNELIERHILKDELRFDGYAHLFKYHIVI